MGFFAVCVFILVARYWILPHIDTWRPDITQFVSSRLQVELQASSISAEWRRANPSIVLTGVSLSPAGPESGAPRPVLNIPILSAQLSWRSLLEFRPAFTLLNASGIELDIRRDVTGKIHALGRTFDPNRATSSDDLWVNVLDWLTAQKNITLGDASIRWTDDLRGAPPLAFDHVSLGYASRGGKREISFSARPPVDLGQSVDASMVISALRDIRDADSQPAESGAVSTMALPNMDAQVYLKLSGLRPGAWAPWLDLSPTLSTEQVTGQARLDINQGRLQTLTTDIQLRDANWHPGHGVQIAANALHLYVTGRADDYLSLLLPDEQSVASGGRDAALSYRLLSKGLALHADYEFSHPLDLGSVVARGDAGRRQAAGFYISAAQAGIVTRDGRATVRGSWRQGGSSAAGVIDMTGHVEQAAITAVANYLPARLGGHVADWLKHGLLAGQLRDANLVLRGDLIHFPFHEMPAAGDFSLAGPYHDVIIDYLPAHGNEPGWPSLQAMQGTLALHGADLKLTAKEGITRPVRGKEIKLRNVQAHIPDLEHNAVLSVKGDTQGPASSYLALMSHSPLGSMLDNVLDKASASGEWVVPLSLSIPLAHGDQTTVQGLVRFNGNTIRLSPEMPALADAKGELAFSQTSVSTNDLIGRFLGGPMKLSGQVGVPGKSMRMQGQVTADALAQYVGLQGMRRLKGKVSYTAEIERNRSQDLTLSITSDLNGLSADLPAPLNKSAKSLMPLKAEWKTQGNRGARELRIQLGNDIRVLLLQRRDNDGEQSPFFYAGSLAVNEPLQSSTGGLRLDIRYPTLAIDAWSAIADEFGQTARDPSVPQKTVFSGANTQQGGLLPPLAYLRMQSKQATYHGMVMDKATVTAQQLQPGQWRLDVSSTQTAGTVQWKASGGEIRGALDANFDRLDMGSAEPDQDNSPESRGKSGADTASAQDGATLVSDDVLDLPAINLHIKRLRLYGHYAGELSVVGVNATRRAVWRLENFRLGSKHAALVGSGEWRLAGKQRGLTINAHADIKDFGAYLTEAGFPGIIIDGHGTFDGQVRWHNMPWAFDRSDVNGNIRFDLAKGRFSNVNSHSAQLLELLSLQSVSRLATLKSNPVSLAREGFPFDSLRGSAVSEQGILSSKDYRVVGPAGTIVLEGRTNLMDESLDLQAVVIPNLDISGATIAAGIAINPIVGVGAFLAQWLLKAPLSQAMASQYHITGEWSDPKIQESASPPVKAHSSFRNIPEH